MTYESIKEAIQPLLQQRSVIASGFGLDVYPSSLMVKKERVQFRFPKSKKKRIRRKWAKRSDNWKIVEVHTAVQVGNKLMVSPTMYQKLKDGSRLL